MVKGAVRFHDRIERRSLANPNKEFFKSQALYLLVHTSLTFPDFYDADAVLTGIRTDYILRLSVSLIVLAHGRLQLALRVASDLLGRYVRCKGRIAISGFATGLATGFDG